MMFLLGQELFILPQFCYHLSMVKGKEYHRDWYARNVDERRKYARDYYHANKEKIKANAEARGEPKRARDRVKKWKQENPERVKINGQRFRDKHRESERARKRKYWADNKVKISDRRRQLNADKIDEVRAKKAAYAAKYRERDRISCNKNWLQRNPERRADIAKKYKKKNCARYAALAAKRRARKLRATPIWADLSAIAVFYETAERLNMTVDHIVPLQGNNVCGLHVERNLQLLSKSENSRKHNRFIDEHAIPAPA